MNRAPFIWLSLATLVIGYGVIFLGVFALIDNQNSDQSLAWLLGGTMAVVLCLMIWFGVALGVKRLHDMDMNGAHMIWIMLLQIFNNVIAQHAPAAAALLFSLISIGIALWLMCTRGTNGSNRYGTPLVNFPGNALSA